MKKHAIDILIFSLLFAFVADSIDADEFLSQSPLLHEEYLGQVVGGCVPASGNLPLPKVFSPGHTGPSKVIVQRVDEDSPSLPTVIYTVQRMIDSPSGKSSTYFVSPNLSRSPSIYFLSRLNN